MLDSFYLIEEQIQMARRHLPHGYSRELPRLLSGPSAGLPRVYDIVLELLTDVRDAPEEILPGDHSYRKVGFHPIEKAGPWCIMASL